MKPVLALVGLICTICCKSSPSDILILRLMEHCRQHLADSASSIHKKRRCPRCLNPFTTNTAVVEHQKAHRSGCEQQLVQDSDEISDLTWDGIKSDVSKFGSFKRLPAPLRQTIDLWVQDNLYSYAPNDTLPKRQGELRKWYMTWRILFPSVDIPAHPCKFTPFNYLSFMS